MLKFILLILVIGTLTNILVICEARDDIQRNDKGDAFDKTGSTSPGDVYGTKDGEKFYKKKYSKEKKYSNPEKESYLKKNHDRERKKYKNIEMEYLDDSVDIPKNKKYSKYVKRESHYENPSKNKNIGYHDKSNSYEKGKMNKYKDVQGVIYENEAPRSLHHDVDVNYLDPRNKLESSDEVLREVIYENEAPRSLLHDIDVNYLDPHNKLESSDEVIAVKKDRKNSKKGGNNKDGNGNEKKDKDDYYKNLKENDLISVPSTNNSALVARYIIHNVDWTALGTLSVNSKFKGSPFVNVISVSDGPLNKGSGVPFFYMTPMDFSSIDMKKDDRCSITATLAQTDYCKIRNLDPESPLCSRLILVGKIKKVKSNSEEENFAKLALFSKHPEMKTWPADHEWFFSKLKIKQIILINHFGGATYVNLHDYFNVFNA